MSGDGVKSLSRVRIIDGWVAWWGAKILVTDKPGCVFIHTYVPISALSVAVVQCFSRCCVFVKVFHSCGGSNVFMFFPLASFKWCPCISLFVEAKREVLFGAAHHSVLDQIASGLNTSQWLHPAEDQRVGPATHWRGCISGQLSPWVHLAVVYCSF